MAREEWLAPICTLLCAYRWRRSKSQRDAWRQSCLHSQRAFSPAHDWSVSLWTARSRTLSVKRIDQIRSKLNQSHNRRFSIWRDRQSDSQFVRLKWGCHARPESRRQRWDGEAHTQLASFFHPVPTSSHIRHADRRMGLVKFGVIWND